MAERAGYNDPVEIAFSTFMKGPPCECMNARKWENVKTEIYGKHNLRIEVSARLQRIWHAKGGVHSTGPESSKMEGRPAPEVT